MEIIRKKAFARAGIIGNPSDGYGGKTISVLIPNFYAQATLYEWDEVEILTCENDSTRFRSVEQLVQDVKLHGYYGGVRLIKATIKRFVEYCHAQGLRLHGRNFTVRYETTIPRAVGMAGSSAIIVATLRCLMAFYGVDIPLHLQPSLVLSVERAELGIAAGLQDRVIQVFGGMVYMDFAPDKMRTENGLEFGRYAPLPYAEERDLPPFYVAFKTEVGEPTEITHGSLRHRWNEGDPTVHAAMARFAELTDLAKDAILARDWAELGRLMDRNFDLRRSICAIAPGQLEMVEVARNAGGSAKFAGSGGAIIGTYDSEATLARLCADLGALQCSVVRLHSQ